MIYGYARVLTDGQSVDAQVTALTGSGAGRVFRELASGATTDRTQFRRLLGKLAEFERDLIRACTGAGRERAKARSVKLGRKPKLTDHQKRDAIRRRDHGDETVREITRSSHTVRFPD